MAFLLRISLLKKFMGTSLIPQQEEIHFNSLMVLIEQSEKPQK